MYTKASAICLFRFDHHMYLRKETVFCNICRETSNSLQQTSANLIAPSPSISFIPSVTKCFIWWCSIANRPITFTGHELLRIHLHGSLLWIHFHWSLLRIHLHRSLPRIHLHGSLPRIHLHGSLPRIHLHGSLLLH